MNPCWIRSADRDSTQPAKATKSLPTSQPQWPPDKFTCLVHQPWVNRRSPIGPKQRDQWNPILLLGAVGINQNQLGNHQERWGCRGNDCLTCDEACTHVCGCVVSKLARPSSYAGRSPAHGWSDASFRSNRNGRPIEERRVRPCCGRRPAGLWPDRDT